MELPGELFERIIGQAAPRFGAASHEKRKSQRIPLRQKVVIVRQMGRLKEVGLLREVSISGVSLLHPRGMMPGEPFVVLFPVGKAGKPQPVAYEAIRSVASPVGFVIGAACRGVLIKGAEPQDAPKDLNAEAA